MSAPKTFVEIMHDQASGNVPLGAIKHGLAMMEPFIGGIIITRDTRRMKVGQPDAPTLNTEHIRSFPKLPANITIVATDRPIYSKGEVYDDAPESALRTPTIKAAGVALRGTGVSVILLHVGDTQGNGEAGVAAVTAHEVGHIFGLRDESPNGHCEDNTCIMLAHVEVPDKEIRIDRSTRMKRLKAAFGREELLVVDRPKVSFCAPCQVELIKKAEPVTKRFARDNLSRGYKF